MNTAIGKEFLEHPSGLMLERMEITASVFSWIFDIDTFKRGSPLSLGSRKCRMNVTSEDWNLYDDQCSVSEHPGHCDVIRSFYR